MADLNSRERRKLEELFGMGSGYVLNFSDRTYSEFFDEFVGRDIDLPQYFKDGASKAKRLRAFWELESNALVGKCINELIAHGLDSGCMHANRHHVDECRAIATRLCMEQPVADIDAITATVDERDFETAARLAREAIEKNEPEAGLDRLHVFAVKYVRSLCEQRGLPASRDIPLNGLFGSYVKRLAQDGHLQSEMTERILKSSIANLEAFNHVRNKHSLAHDNLILSYDEALLVFNHVASCVRFIKSLEARLRTTTSKSASVTDDFPF